MAQVFVRPVSPPGKEQPPFVWWVDVLIVLVVAAVTYAVVAMATRWASPLTPTVKIDLSPSALPGYAGLSTMRMAIAYLFAAAFSITYARLAVAGRMFERVLIPLLDILQSIPILSFMPGVVLGLVALFPHSTFGLELASVVLIFTGQAWNLAFGFYQSLLTIPKELHEAARIYRLNPWTRFTRLELPFGMIPFIWNSMMSWAGGWFFLMASEQFTLGNKDFRLPGLGSYLKAAANAGDLLALFLGLLTLVVVIVLLDFFLWRPLVAWSERFKVEQTGAGEAATSPVLTALRRSMVREWVADRIVAPVGARIDRWLSRLFVRPQADSRSGNPKASLPRPLQGLPLAGLLVVLVGCGIWGTLGAVQMLIQVKPTEWLAIGAGTLATFLRTCVALVIATAWTVPAGVAIGLNPRWAKRIQPLVQVVASIPATGIFPALLLVLLSLPGGLNLAAIALMLLGTQWYVLFNVIAGAMAIPTDLQEAAKIFKLSGWQRWRNLILPAIFPALVTGMITATGGAWNASIVAEYVTFGGSKYATVGLGAVIAGAADVGNFPVLLAGTLVMAAVVVAINWMVWHRLYGLARERFRLE